jgi:hypothetical protein
VPIRTPDQQLRLTPVMFELGARPHPPRALYRSYLAQSDVFVGIYWQRYGRIAPEMDISDLEDELARPTGRSPTSRSCMICWRTTSPCCSRSGSAARCKLRLVDLAPARVDERAHQIVGKRGGDVEVQ